ncbi:hypothetical protein [Saccharothrix hoggarensis]|uniref:Uncharacterized protein n=1 Tax=Saccharothrix hoggarensis TaxID=913853 RepID=A0ABW3QME1_9PSEU
MTSNASARTWLASCRRCAWHVVSWRKEWAQQARDDHRRAHAVDPVQAHRDRYRYRGRLNASQTLLLDLAASGALACHFTREFTLDTDLGGSWYPNHLPHGLGHWIPGLVDAGLLRIRPTWRTSGLYVPTAAARRAVGERR